MSNEQSFVLFTSLYNETNEARVEEYKRCIEKNLQNPLIDEYVVFFDTSNTALPNLLLDYLKNLPVRIIYIEGRPTFSYLFQKANGSYFNRRILLANADIYFDSSLFHVTSIDYENCIIFLTRWNEDKNGKLAAESFWDRPNEMSQDAWIFKTPIRDDNLGDIALGTWMCDGRLSKWAYENSYRVINPCLEVRAIHVHNTNIRNYPKHNLLTYWEIVNNRICCGLTNSFFQKSQIGLEEVIEKIKRIQHPSCVYLTETVRETLADEVLNIFESNSYSITTINSLKLFCNNIHNFLQAGICFILMSNSDFEKINRELFGKCYLSWCGDVVNTAQQDIKLYVLSASGD